MGSVRGAKNKKNPKQFGEGDEGVRIDTSGRTRKGHPPMFDEIMDAAHAIEEKLVGPNKSKD